MGKGSTIEDLRGDLDAARFLVHLPTTWSPVDFSAHALARGYVARAARFRPQLDRGTFVTSSNAGRGPCPRTSEGVTSTPL